MPNDNKGLIYLKSRLQEGLNLGKSLQELLCQGVLYRWDDLEKMCQKLNEKANIYDFLAMVLKENKDKIIKICDALDEFKNDAHSLSLCCGKMLKI